MNLGNLLRRKGQAAKAVECYQEAARLSPGLAAAYYSLGLVSAEQGEAEDAIKHYRTAIQVDPRLFQAHCNLGKLLIDEGRLDEAIHHLQTAVAIQPDDHLSHRNLGRALQKKGSPHQAFVHLFQSHYLQKEYLAAAQLSADTFLADPELAGDFQAGYRYRAARAAALAGTGQGNDAAKLSEAEREQWRAQARNWLQLELADWAKQIDMGTAADRIQAEKALSQWREAPDLAGLRERDAMDRLSADERKECDALWREVTALRNRARTAMSKGFPR
jgi:Flp pilus assembly protein TadD